ncbi:hypothetical protein DFAR_630044 [Desulfarculales bacterium]
MNRFYIIVFSRDACLGQHCSGNTGHLAMLNQRWFKDASWIKKMEDNQLLKFSGSEVSSL